MIRRVTVLLTSMALATCATSTSPAGRWIGAVTPTTPGPTCQPTRGLLEIKQGIVTFAPNEGIWILQGGVGSDGTLYADHSQVGADKKPFETTLEAHWTPQSITGTYTTPRCKFAVTLNKA